MQTISMNAASDTVFELANSSEIKISFIPAPLDPTEAPHISLGNIRYSALKESGGPPVGGWESL
jgi:hypothetical protein